jgi:hypothetical protein
MAPGGGPSDLWLYVIFSVAIIAVVVGLVLFYEYQPGGPLNPRPTPVKVEIYEVVWEQYNNSLGTQPGFSTIVGWTVNVSWSLTCQSFFGFNESCSTGSVHIVTPGFGLVSTNAPHTWYSGSTSADFVVRVGVLMPTTNYTGDLTIDLY